MPAFQTVTARAPGKLILMGEHAAVYGRPALVAALGLHTRATIALAEEASDAEIGVEAESRSVSWDLPNLGLVGRADWSALGTEAERFRGAWERQLEDATSSDLERLRRGDPARVVKLALAESLGEGDLPPSMSVRVRSNLPVGAGFGSSASVAVSVAAALRMLLEGELDPATVEAIALEVERREHGRPSGIDHGTVLYGGVQWMERARRDLLNRELLVGVAPALEDLAVFDSGRPAESTGEMVDSVRRRFAGRAERLEAILDAMESDVRQLREWLESGCRDGEVLVELLRDFEGRLELLGVVPQSVRELVRQVEAAGGAAKISGAGALSGSSAGALLVYHPHRPPRSLSALSALRPLEAALGVAGVEVEETA